MDAYGSVDRFYPTLDNFDTASDLHQFDGNNQALNIDLDSFIEYIHVLFIMGPSLTSS